VGTLVIAGPKVLDFYDDFCNHRATLVKADGKDILSVTLLLIVISWPEETATPVLDNHS
jgi:hypothetical protein